MLHKLRPWIFYSNYRLFCRSTRLSCVKMERSKADPSSGEALEEDPPPMPLPSFPSHDWIGPADKKSNLRLIILAQPEQETDSERDYRVMRTATYEWNHQFWSKQNEIFIKAKEQFVQERLGNKQKEIKDSSGNEAVISGVKQVLSAEEMAEFYQQFLKENQHSFKDYNKQWYSKNFSLLWPAIKANVSKLMKKNKR
nr:COA8 family protein CBG23705, mitochondrial-like [Lytechinus pictus]